MELSKWVKLIDLTKEIQFEKFSLSDKFIHVANIIATPKDANRKTIITFNPVIDKSRWKEETAQWIYILTINNHIVKIGGTRNGLKNRTASYLCGHHTEDRGKSGKCSVTNAYIYNTLHYYITDGNEVKMYGYRIPDIKVYVDIWGNHIEVDAQVYNAYESVAIKKYLDEVGHQPQLSLNSDPNYK